MPGLKRRTLATALAAVAAGPAPAWMRLPPTPVLPPPASVGTLATADGARLFHAEFGAGSGAGAGPPVLLLHGGLANANYWGHLVAALAGGHRVLVMDARGHGRSTLGGAGLSYEMLARDALAVIAERAAERCAVVGWSDGGIAGLIMASMAPQRISRLFAFGANDSQGGGRPDAQSRPTVQAYLARCAAEYRALAPHPADFSRLRQALQAMWSRGPDLPPSRLGTIGVPTTVSAGEHDEFIGLDQTRALAAAIRGSRLSIEPGVSHFAMLQDPGRFAASVKEFLTR